MCIYFYISVARTLGASFHFFEVVNIESVMESILGADGRHACFCASLLIPTIGGTNDVSDPLLARINQNCLE